MKVKTQWYMRLFRAVSGLTRKRIAAVLRDTPDSLMFFPEELRAEVDALVTDIRTACAARQAAIMARIAPYLAYPRKEFAAAVATDPDRSVAFLLYDKKDPTPTLLKEMT